MPRVRRCCAIADADRAWRPAGRQASACCSSISAARPHEALIAAGFAAKLRKRGDQGALEAVFNDSVERLRQAQSAARSTALTARARQGLSPEDAAADRTAGQQACSPRKGTHSDIICGSRKTLADFCTYSAACRCRHLPRSSRGSHAEGNRQAEQDQAQQPNQPPKQRARR